jgi:hypothetical protein
VDEICSGRILRIACLFALDRQQLRDAGIDTVTITGGEPMSA